MIHDFKSFSVNTAYSGAVEDRIRRFLPMVRKQAHHLAGSGLGSVEVDDLIQSGLVALTECAQRHDRPDEDGFAAYAKLRVRGAMIDLLRAGSPNARGLGERRRQLDDTRRRLRLELDHDPSAAEMADAMGLDLPKYYALFDNSAGTRLQSIDEVYSESNACFADGEPDAESRLLEVEDRTQLAEAIAALPDRLKLVIQLYFVEELNLSEIAEILGVSVPRVHQLKASALDSLKLELEQVS